MSRTSVAVVLLFCIAGCAQEQRASAPSDVKSNATTQTEFPTVPLHIAKQIDLDPGLGAGVGLPIQCGPDARMYVRFFNDDGDQALVGIAPDGTTTHFTLPFDLGLDNPTSLSLYATDAGVFGHVLGEKTTKLVHYKTPSGVDLGNRKAGPTSDHLVEFSLDGKFKRRVELDMPFKVLQVATFPSGTMLVAGVDSATGTPTVALAKEDGTFLRPITIKGDLSPQAFKPDENALRGMGTLNTKLQMSSLIPDGREILLVRNETDTPVFVVAPSGEVRTIKVQAPTGYRIFSIIPAGRGWMTQFVKDLGKGRVLTKLCSVDRNTGDLQQCYEAEKSLGLGFACGTDEGTFFFLKGGTAEKPNSSTLVVASAN